MILIVAKFEVKPDRRDEFLAMTEEFTGAVRAEPGNRSFEWFESTERPDEFVLVEEFDCPEAGEAHVATEHFKMAMEQLPDLLAETPKIVHLELPGAGWSELVELALRRAT